MTWHKNDSMATAIVLYILFLIIFLIISSLILRHTIKYSYLSPRFKFVVGGFAIISLIVVVFSIYLLFKMGPSSTSSSTSNFNSAPVSVPSSGDLNF